MVVDVRVALCTWTETVHGVFGTKTAHAGYARKNLSPLIQALGNNVGTVKESRKERGVRRIERGERGERREERHTSYAF